MKTTMKKTAAYLLALILVLQITPVFAAATYSGVYTPGNVIYRDRLEIITNDAGIMTVGQKIQLSITTGYENPVWESNHPEIATVDSTGLVEAVAAGQVKITVSSDGYTDSVTLRVVGEAAANQNDGDTEKIIVIVNCAKSKVEYDGATHTNTFSMTSTNPRFDAGKVTLVTEGHQAVGTACGAYTDSLTADDFRYEGEEVEFVVSNGWMQIKPKDITIKADDLTIREGENPAYTATVTEGLVEGEALDLSAMTFTVDGENIYPDVEKGEIIGNYKVAKVISGKLAVITSQESNKSVTISSDWPSDRLGYVGARITLTAYVTGFNEGEYTLQWQYSVNGEDWNDQPGANGETYTYTLNEITTHYTWRVMVYDVD